MFETIVKPILDVFRKRDRRAPHLVVGETGELAAAEYLKQREGYRIVATNYRITLGRGLDGRKISGEIDLIAYDKDVLVFGEVKSRTSDEFAPPERAVNLRKQRQIARSAKRYRNLMSVTGESYRYDVVSVTIIGAQYRVELLKNFFDDRVFQRGRYFRER